MQLEKCEGLGFRVYQSAQCDLAAAVKTAKYASVIYAYTYLCINSTHCFDMHLVPTKRPNCKSHCRKEVVVGHVQDRTASKGRIGRQQACCLHWQLVWMTAQVDVLSFSRIQSTAQRRR